MKGTEKQIKLAEDIVEFAKKVMENMETEMKKEASDMYEDAKAMHKTIIENMDQMNAGDIIEDFGYELKITTNPKQDYMDFSGKILVAEKTKGRNYRNK